MQSLSFFFVALIVVSLAAAAGAQDCAAGCSGDFAPATGKDGLVYVNRCVAECQGVEVVSVGSSDNSVGAVRRVQQADLEAHEDEQYRFLDFARVRRFRPSLRGNSGAAAVGAPSMVGLPADRVLCFDAARGAIYASAEPAQLPADPTAAVDFPAQQGDGGDVYVRTEQPEQPEQQQPGGDIEGLDSLEPSVQLGRKLRAVASPDERAEVAEQPAGELAAVGQLLAHGQRSHCTAALIGERTLLTAAHCVYDRATGAFASGLYFVPGRFVDASGAIRAPAGGFDVAEVFLPSRFVVGASADAWANDMAVVRLAPNVRLGAAVGRLGVRVQPPAQVPAAGSAVTPEADGEVKPTSAAGARASGRRMGPSAVSRGPQAAAGWAGPLATAGYPSDKPEGTLVTTTCNAQQFDGATGGTFKLLGCSTSFGQSGSPLIAPGGLVRGVVAFEVSGPKGYNGGSVITPMMWSSLIEKHLV